MTRKEYNSVVDYAIDCGINNGFIQEGDVAEEASYLNLTMRAYDYIIVTEIITNVLAGLIYGE